MDDTRLVMTIAEDEILEIVVSQSMKKNNYLKNRE